MDSGQRLSSFKVNQPAFPSHRSRSLPLNLLPATYGQQQPAWSRSNDRCHTHTILHFYSQCFTFKCDSSWRRLGGSRTKTTPSARFGAGMSCGLSSERENRKRCSKRCLFGNAVHRQALTRPFGTHELQARRLSCRRRKLFRGESLVEPAAKMIIHICISNPTTKSWPSMLARMVLFPEFSIASLKNL